MFMKLELRSVRIKDCGPIDDIKIDFFDASGKTLPVCVIGGANGSGKTTVLEIIASVSEGLSGRSGRRPSDFLKAKQSVYARIDWRVGDFDFSQSYGLPPNDAELKSDRLNVEPKTPEGGKINTTHVFTSLNQEITLLEG